MEQLASRTPPADVGAVRVFGHSVGAWMAYEAARQLRSLDGRTAVHLFVSGRGTQRRLRRSSSGRQRSIDELLAILDRYGGTPAAIMQRPELARRSLPACEPILPVDGYTVDPGDIDCPITAFGGERPRDPDAFYERFHPRKIPHLRSDFTSPAPEALAKEFASHPADLGHVRADNSNVAQTAEIPSGLVSEEIQMWTARFF